MLQIYILFRYLTVLFSGIYSLFSGGINFMNWKDSFCYFCYQYNIKS